MPDIASGDVRAQTAQFASAPAGPLSAESTQVTKQYVFNETGNIMIASTSLNTELPPSVRQLFAEVGEFFVSMLMKIRSSTNPVTKEPYSIYDYNAIMDVIDQSGRFAQLTSEDIEYTTDSFGAIYSQELVKELLGLSTGMGTLSFAQGMIASIGKAGLQLIAENDPSDSKVANIIFICEYLLGVPTVSAIVVSCDAIENSQTFQMGPCFKEISTSTSLTLHKDTYVFTSQSATQSVGSSKPQEGG